MDLILDPMDEYVLDDLYEKYASAWPAPAQTSAKLCQKIANSIIPIMSTDFSKAKLGELCHQLPFMKQHSDSAFIEGTDSIGSAVEDHASNATMMMGGISSMNDSLGMGEGKLDMADSTPYWLDRDSYGRQFLSLYMVTFLGAFAMYFILNTFIYFAWYDKERWGKHSRFLKNQVRREITLSLWSMPIMVLLTVPWFVGEVRGGSMLYSNFTDMKIPFLPDPFGSYLYIVVSMFAFIIMTDYWVYWIHRTLHHPLLYSRLHKPHHQWIVCTPFASHAFHPLDGYSQSLPYHVFINTIPMWRPLYLTLYVGINIWTMSIHDGAFWYSKWLAKRNKNKKGGSKVVDDSAAASSNSKSNDKPTIDFLNSSAHHNLHHMYFTVNYGQYFTFWDRIGGSYRKPSEKLVQSKLD